MKSLVADYGGAFHDGSVCGRSGVQSPLVFEILENKTLTKQCAIGQGESLSSIYFCCFYSCFDCGAGLYFFDHSVASQMAQQKEFNLRKPSAYHYDILLLGLTVRLSLILSSLIVIYISDPIGIDDLLWIKNFRHCFVD